MDEQVVSRHYSIIGDRGWRVGHRNAKCDCEAEHRIDPARRQQHSPTMPVNTTRTITRGLSSAIQSAVVAPSSTVSGSPGSILTGGGAIFMAMSLMWVRSPADHRITGTSSKV